MCKHYWSVSWLQSGCQGPGKWAKWLCLHHIWAAVLLGLRKKSSSRGLICKEHARHCLQAYQLDHPVHEAQGTFTVQVCPTVCQDPTYRCKSQCSWSVRRASWRGDLEHHRVAQKHLCKWQAALASWPLMAWNNPRWNESLFRHMRADKSKYRRVALSRTGQRNLLSAHHLFAAVMSRHHFWALLQYLHFCDNSLPQSEDRL